MNKEPEELVKDCFVINGENGKPIFNGNFVTFINYKDNREGVKSIGIISFAPDYLRFEICVFEETKICSINSDNYTVIDFLPFGQDLFGNINAYFSE